MTRVLPWVPCLPGDAAWDERLRDTAGVLGAVSWGAVQWIEGFQPDYSPQEMQRMGVFGGAYWAGTLGDERRMHLVRALGRVHAPPECDLAARSIRGKQCATKNRFGVPASLLRGWWLDKGLIDYRDPLGWYEWYWWYWHGRRIAVYDDWQVGRWKRFKERHGRAYHMRPSDGSAQALLHWSVRAYNPVDHLMSPR